ncbi:MULTISPECIES: hypothetical protein [Methylobacter]
MNEEEMLRKKKNDAIARGLIERMGLRVPVVDPVGNASENPADSNAKSEDC